MNTTPSSALGDPSRLRALHNTDLMDTPPDPVMESAVRVAARLLAAPVAIVSLVDERRQFFAAAAGLAEPWAGKRETPLTHSFCQQVVTGAVPLVVTDARRDPRVQDNLAIPDLGVVAYLGVPLTGPAGEVLGALCVIDDQPRDWDVADVTHLRDLALMVTDDLQLRISANQRREALTWLDHTVRNSAAAFELETAVIIHDEADLSGGLTVIDAAAHRFARTVLDASQRAAQQVLASSALQTDVVHLLRELASDRLSDPTTCPLVVADEGAPLMVRAAPAPLRLALIDLAEAASDGGRQTATISAWRDGAWIRVRAEAPGEPLSSTASQSLLRRGDHADAAPQGRPSLAEMASARLGARVVIPSISCRAVDLLLLPAGSAAV